MTRASTLLLALLIIEVLLGTLCFVVARGERESRALRLWGLGQLVFAAGVLITLPAAIPFDLRKVVGNALIALAPILCVEGVLSHTGWRLHRRWVVAGFLATVAVLVANHASGHFVLLIDFLAPAQIANVLFVVAALALLRSPPPDARAAARFLAALFTMNVVVWTARMLGIWLSLGGTNDRDRADLTVALFGIVQLVSAVATTLALFWVEVRKMQAELERVAFSDALTGLPNRRATLRRCAEELARASRRQQPLAMVVFDVDHFKRVNDTHGHLAGDAVLRHVAAVMSADTREEDVIGRIGGEEFVLLLTDQPAAAAHETADRLRARVAAAPLLHGGSELSVSMSGGLALFPDDAANWDALFAVADRRLYAAKQAGRNRVEGVAVAAAVAD